MAEHLSTQHVERYRQRAMSPAELLTADDHLATCETCRQRLSQGEPLRATFTSLRADLEAEAQAKPAHLSYEQLAAYVDNNLKEVDREIVETHLELCRQCAEEVCDLREFKAAMMAYPVEQSARAAGNLQAVADFGHPSSPVKDSVLIPGPTLLERFVAFWRVPAHWVPIQIAAITMVAALLVWMALLPLRRQVADLQAQLAQVRQETERVQQDYKTARTTVANLQTQLAELQQSQLPKTGVSPPSLLALNDRGGRVTLDPEGNLTGLGSLPSLYYQTVKTVLMTQRVKTPPLLAGLIGRAGTLLGGSGEGVPFALLSPVGTVVPTDRPTFRWRPLSGATSYRVTVYDANFNPVATSPSLTGTEWTVSSSLKRGGVYSWQVAARKEGKEVTSPTPPAPEAKFQVLDPAKADELQRAKQTYANSHLVLGTLYAQAGLIDETEREFQALVNANPQSPVAIKLLQSVRAWRQRF